MGLFSKKINKYTTIKTEKFPRIDMGDNAFWQNLYNVIDDNTEFDKCSKLLFIVDAGVNKIYKEALKTLANKSRYHGFKYGFQIEEIYNYLITYTEDTFVKKSDIPEDKQEDYKYARYYCIPKLDNADKDTLVVFIGGGKIADICDRDFGHKKIYVPTNFQSMIKYCFMIKSDGIIIDTTFAMELSYGLIQPSMITAIDYFYKFEWSGEPSTMYDEFKYKFIPKTEDIHFIEEAVNKITSIKEASNLDPETKEMSRMYQKMLIYIDSDYGYFFFNILKCVPKLTFQEAYMVGFLWNRALLRFEDCLYASQMGGFPKKNIFSEEDTFLTNLLNVCYCVYNRDYFNSIMNMALYNIKDIYESSQSLGTYFNAYIDEVNRLFIGDTLDEKRYKAFAEAILRMYKLMK